MPSSSHPEQNHRDPEAISNRLPILPLRNTVAFPFVMMPLSIGIPRSIKRIEDAIRHDNYVKSKASRLGIDPAAFEKADVHLRVPAGAIPKDGPSAGIAMVAAITGLFSRRPVRGDIGMTGEMTLRGRLLPVGGIKMKVPAAHRAGLKSVILPNKDTVDLEDLPDNVRGDISFMAVDRIDEALDAAFKSSVGNQKNLSLRFQTGDRYGSSKIG